MKGRIKNSTGATTNGLLLPVVGKVRVGYVGEDGNPVSVDWFVPKSKYEGLFKKVYGDKPNTIQIVFLSDDPEKVCNEFYEYRDADGNVVAKGDGEVFSVWDEESVSYRIRTVEDFPNLMETIARDYPSKTGWRTTLTLTFVLPRVQGIMGLWQFQTQGSRSTVSNIRDTFDMVLETNGKVKGVLFDLSVRMAVSQQPGRTLKYPVVSLVPNESEENKNLLQSCLKLEK